MALGTRNWGPKNTTQYSYTADTRFRNKNDVTNLNNHLVDYMYVFSCI